MARSRVLRSSFEGGEWSPRMFGRVDLGKYNQAAEQVENLLVQPQGGLTRRPGTRYVAAAKTTGATRLLKHVFSPTQSYVIEAGDNYFRFYANQGQIVVNQTDAAITNGNFSDDLTGWDDTSSGSGAGISVENSRVAVAGATGTALGNMTHGGSTLALAFDGDTTKEYIECARTTDSPAYIGKDWGSTKTITGFRIWGATDKGFKQAESSRVVITLQGSSDNFAASVVDLAETAIVDNQDARKITVFSGINVGTAYRYHRIKLSGGKSSYGFGVAQVQFFESGSSLKRLLLTPGSGTAQAEQDVTVGASYRGQRHTLRFQVICAASTYARVRIGATSGGAEFMGSKRAGNGWHSFSFRPTASPFYVQFRTSDTQAIRIDNVSISGSAGAVPYELETPYDATDLRDLRYVQAADVMWLVHPRHPPHKLIRQDHDRWNLEEVRNLDGPYQDEDPDNTVTIQPSARTGSVTLTASETTFAPGDVGSVWRIGPPGGRPGYPKWTAGTSVSGNAYYQYEGNVYQATGSGTTGTAPPVHERGVVSDGVVGWRYINRQGWGCARITAYTSGTVVTAQVEKRLDDTAVVSGTEVWRRPAFTITAGWPDVVALAEGRLWYGRGTQIWGSRVGAYDDFTPEDLDDDAITWQLTGQQVPNIVGIVGGERMVVLTTLGPFVFRSSDNDEPLTPKNVRAKRMNAAGCADVEAVAAGDAVLYLSNNRQRLYEISPNIQADTGFGVVELTILSDHIMGSGAVEMQWAREPHSMLWVLRKDGQVATMTYNRAEQVVAWSRQVLGGYERTNLRARAVAMAVIPGASDTNKRDEVWFVVRRRINDTVVQHVEFLEAELRYDSLPEDAFFVDAGLRLDDPYTITDITETSTRVKVTAKAHTFAEGDFVEIEGAAEDPVPTDAQIRAGTHISINGRFKVMELAGDQFSLYDMRKGTVIAPSKVGAWQGGGVVRKLVSSVSGLDHLIGETVNILGDGAELTDREVNGSGAVSLGTWCAKVAVGLPQLYRYKGLKIAEGGTVGPAIGAKRKITHCIVGLIGALECRIGFDPDNLAQVVVRDVDQPMGKAPPLFTGEQKVPTPLGYLTDPRIIIRGDSALPMNVTHVVLDDVLTSDLS